MAVYNLEERTLMFAIAVKNFTKKLPRTIENTEYIKQLIRSSASVGGNGWFKSQEEMRLSLIKEATELMNIFGAILKKLN